MKYNIKPSDMTADQRECFDLLCDVYGGEHHLDGILREYGDGIELTTDLCHDLATWDYNGLTHLVVLAHDRCIRVGIGPCNHRMLRITLHKRHERNGVNWKRHPEIEDAIALIRSRYSSAPDDAPELLHGLRTG